MDAEDWEVEVDLDAPLPKPVEASSIDTLTNGGMTASKGVDSRNRHGQNPTIDVTFPNGVVIRVRQDTANDRPVVQVFGASRVDPFGAGSDALLGEPTAGYEATE